MAEEEAYLGSMLLYVAAHTRGSKARQSYDKIKQQQQYIQSKVMRVFIQ